MKRTIITGIALVLAAHTSLAQSNTPAAPQPVGRRVTQDLSKWDTNKNGRLDGEEQAAFRRDRIRERQAQLDASWRQFARSTGISKRTNAVPSPSGRG
jgi:hypothetical protein